MPFLCTHKRSLLYDSANRVVCLAWNEKKNKSNYLLQSIDLNEEIFFFLKKNIRLIDDAIKINWNKFIFTSKTFQFILFIGIEISKIGTTWFVTFRRKIIKIKVWFNVCNWFFTVFVDYFQVLRKITRCDDKLETKYSH